MKKVLIFGCAGFVGRYLAHELLLHDYQVIGSDICDYITRPNDPFFSYHKADLLNYDSVASLIQTSKPDFIVNLAAISSIGYSWKIPQQTINVNVNGTVNILEAVHQSQLNPKFLLIGSSEEYAICDSPIPESHPLVANNPYGISKVAQDQFAELYRHKYDLNIVCTRTFNHTGVGQSDQFVLPSFIKQVATIHNSGRNGSVSVGNLSVRRDIGDVRDMVSAYRLLLESPTNHPVYNVGSGLCHSLQSLLDYIVSLTPQSVEIYIDPDRSRRIDNPVIWCDNTLIQSDIGWSPKHSIFQTIDSMFESFISKH